MTSLKQAYRGYYSATCALIRIGVFCATMFLALCVAPTASLAATKYWIGSAGGNINNNANWSTTAGSACGANNNTTAPGASDVATFVSDCLNNANFGSNTTLSGINIAAGYTGAISQTPGVFVTTTTFTQADGTYSATELLTISGGNFTKTGGNFDEGTGTTTFSGGGSRTFDVATTETLHNVVVSKTTATILTIASGDTMVITGALTLTDGLVNTGVLDVRGNVTQAATFDGGTATIDFGDNAVAQNYTIDGGIGPMIRFDDDADKNDSVVVNANATLYGINITSNFDIIDPLDSNVIPISYNGNGSGPYSLNLGAGGFFQGAGTFTAPPSLTISAGNFTKTGGTYDEGTGTTTFSGGSNRTFDVVTTETLHNVVVGKTTATILTIASGDTMVITGALTLTDGLVNTGVLDVRGNVSVASTYDGGTSPLLFSGSATQTFEFTGATGLYDGDIIVNKSGGQVNLSSDLVMDASGQDLIITAGTLDVTASNYNIEIFGNLHVFGTLNNRSNTVSFIGANQTVLGNITYNNFTKTDSVDDEADRTLTIGGGSTQTINGLLTLTGTDATDRVNLRSYTPRTQWNIISNGTLNIDWVDVADSNASPVIIYSNTVSTGNNINWGFDEVAPTITNISSDKPNGTYGTGEVIDINLAFSETVTSSGLVAVLLETGTLDRSCAVSVTNAITATCNYIVQAGDNSSDLTVKSMSGIIADHDGNLVANFVPTTNLAANKNLVIHTGAVVPNGSSIWYKRLGGAGNDNGHGITTDPSGNVIVTGRFGGTGDLNGNGDIADAGEIAAAPYGQEDIFMSAFNSSGTNLWYKRLGGSGWDWGWGITTDSAGNVIVTGRSYYNSDLNGNGDNADVGENAAAPYGSIDIFISKFNSSGTNLWYKRLGGTATDWGHGITTDSSDNVIITGFLNNGTGDLNGDGDIADVGEVTTSPYGIDDIFISAFSSSGTSLWYKRLGGAGYDRAYGISTDSSDNLFVTGWVTGTADLNGDGDTADAGEPEASPYGNWDIFISVFNSSGNNLWYKRIGGAMNDRGWGITADTFGNIIATGYVNGTADLNGDGDTADAGETTAAPYGGDDLIITAFNSSGTNLWYKRLGGAGNDYGHGITIDSSGNALLTGYVNGTADLNGDGDTIDTLETTASPYGDSDIVVIVLDYTAPALTLDPITTPTNSPILIGTANDTANAVSSVEFQLDGTGGSWTACTADDGTFDEASEDFSCELGILSHGAHTAYVRGRDSANNATTSGREAEISFSVVITHSILGNIVSGGNPLLGVTVNGGALGTTASAGDGTYSFTSIIHGTSYTLTPSKTGYAFAPSVLSGTLTSSTTGANFTGTALPVSVSGRIEQGGTPVANATVTLNVGNSVFTTTTNELGDYEFSNAPLGEATLKIEKEGVTLATKEVTLTAGEAFDPELEIIDPGLLSPGVTFWNGFLGMVNILEIINPTGTSVEVEVVMHSLEGAELSHIAVIMPAGSERDLIVNSLEGFASDSYGIISVSTGSEGESLGIDGRVTYYLPSDSSHFSWGEEYDFVFSLPLENSSTGESHAIYNTYNPSTDLVDQSTLAPNWLSLANLSGSAKSFTVRYRSHTGDERAAATVTVPARGRRDIQAGHELSFTPAVGLVSVEPQDATAPYVAVVTRYGVASVPWGYGFGFAVPTRAGNSSPLVLPVGGAGLGVLELVNTENTPNSVSLNWYRQNGALLRTETKHLAAYAQEHLMVSDVLGSNESGMVTMDGAHGVIAGAAGYRYDLVIGRVRAAEYTEAIEPFGSRMSGTFNTYLDMQNWLRVLNVSSARQVLELDYGSGVVKMLTVPPHGRADIVIPAAELGAAASGAFGRFELSSTGPPGVFTSSVVRVKGDVGAEDFMVVTPVR